ncbi:TonB-dependent receptor [Sesbania bispinosa]|nr:TonB-dependent receptor [Sesbania bispinosa]
MRLLIVATCAGCDSAPVAMCRSQTRLRGAWNGCTTDSSRTGTTAWNSSSWERSEEANRRTAGGTTTYNSMTGGGSARQ